MGSLWIGRYFRIDVFIHWSFWALPLFMVAYPPGQPPSEIVLNLAVVFAVFACVLLHEYGHALMARYFGIGTRDITLYPIGGVARLERMSERPWEEFWISVAGPAVNVAIAALLILPAVLLIAPNPGLMMPRHDDSGGALSSLTAEYFFAQVIVRLFVANVVLVIFNMLPVFPMDGGRVLRALLATQMSHVQATRVAVFIAMPLAVLLGLGGWFLLQSPMLAVLAFFVFMAGQQELAAAKAREQQRRRPVYDDDEEPLPVIPVRRAAAPMGPVVTIPLPPLRPVAPPAPAPIPAPAPVLSLQPRISVSTYDPETGQWVEEPRR
jgi:Zn-dependent protease